MDLKKSWEQEEKATFSGWDFSHLKGRMVEDNAPWNYNTMAKKLVRNSVSVLDMGTGGGEIFSSFAPFPAHAVATEGYTPNYITARKRLKLLNVNVIKFSNSRTRKMPFKNGEFDLVLNRHDAFNPEELFRTLKNGGIFLTQQVEKSNLVDLMKMFGTEPKWDNDFQKNKKALVKAGFSIETAKKWKGKVTFKDVGAVVYLLKNVPWIVDGFSVKNNMKELNALQNRIEKRKKMSFIQSKFLIKASK